MQLPPFRFRLLFFSFLITVVLVFFFFFPLFTLIVVLFLLLVVVDLLLLFPLLLLAVRSSDCTRSWLLPYWFGTSSSFVRCLIIRAWFGQDLIFLGDGRNCFRCAAAGSRNGDPPNLEG